MTTFNRPLFAAAAVAAAAFAAGCSTTVTQPGSSADARTGRAALESQSTEAMNKLYGVAAGSREQVARARATLTCPNIVGGALTVGVESGRCILRENGKPDEYYRVTALSVGLQAGAQSHALHYIFNTQEALDQFRATRGWTAGAEANVAIASAGANVSTDTNTMRQPITGYVVNNAGLQAGVALQGMKFTKLDAM